MCEVGNRLVQIFFLELRPTSFRHPNLCVANLPQQEIADAHFARGSNHEVRIGHPAGVQVTGHRLFMNLCRIKLRRPDVRRVAKTAYFYEGFQAAILALPAARISETSNAGSSLRIRALPTRAR